MSGDSTLGRIEVTPRAIASVASDAVLSCYGIVGMSAATVRDGIAEILQVDKLHRGVEVEVVDDSIVVDLYVVVQYGTRISEVAHNVMENVKFRIEQALSMRVNQVNVHVQGLRIGEE